MFIERFYSVRRIEMWNVSFVLIRVILFKSRILYSHMYLLFHFSPLRARIVCIRIVRHRQLLIITYHGTSQSHSMDGRFKTGVLILH